jgi:hypothetical protein
VFKLAEDHGIVLLNGSGFDAPDFGSLAAASALGRPTSSA